MDGGDVEAGLALAVLGVHRGPGLYQRLAQLHVSLPDGQVEDSVAKGLLGVLDLHSKVTSVN